MAAILQTTFSMAFLWMKMYQFWLKFHWNLFLRLQLTILHQWFRLWLGADQVTSHYVNQWWLHSQCIYASLSLNELMLNASHNLHFTNCIHIYLYMHIYIYMAVYYIYIISLTFVIIAVIGIPYFNSMVDICVMVPSMLAIANPSSLPTQMDYTDPVWLKVIKVPLSLFFDTPTTGTLWLALMGYNTITWSKIVRYSINNGGNWGRISIRCWIYKRHPFCEYLWENLLRHNGTTLYHHCCTFMIAALHCRILCHTALHNKRTQVQLAAIIELSLASSVLVAH